MNTTITLTPSTAWTVSATGLIGILAGVFIYSASPNSPPATANPAWWPPAWNSDNTVTVDYPVIACKCLRANTGQQAWGKALNNSLSGVPGTDLVLINPDGTESVLVAGGADAIADPCRDLNVRKALATEQSLTGWMGRILFTRIYGGSNGSDIFAVDLATKAIAQLTKGGYSPNRASDDARPFLIWNAQPCAAPGGRIIFVSNRNGYFPPKGMAATCTQLYAMDSDGSNVEKIGYLNVGSAISPFLLRNGSIAYSTQESQGARNNELWSMWTIDRDGSNWGPLVFDTGSRNGAQYNTDLFHFGTQLSDGTIIAELYYLTTPFGPYFSFHELGPAPAFTSPMFLPKGWQNITPWVSDNDGQATVLPGSNPPVQMGKTLHPSGAPHNDLLTAWTPGDGRGEADAQTMICVIPGGKTTNQPSDMRLIKGDPLYNYFFPIALASYQDIYGIAQPVDPGEVANPSSTPYGWVGTSSLYKNEAFPVGFVKQGQTWSSWSGTVNPTDLVSLGRGLMSPNGPFPFTTQPNFGFQGAVTSLFTSDDIAGVRIITMEAFPDTVNPTLAGWDINRNPAFTNAASERLRIFAEIPVRKFANGVQPVDPDGNPDTSWLCKLPANQPFSFQTIDKNGMTLNYAQTWHQVRPGETRNNCGGCHAHTQTPTDFAKTAAALASYKVFDPVANGTPLLTSKAADQSGQQWTAANDVGLKTVQGVKDVEFLRDIKPILDRSCVPCHSGATPPANLRFDDYAPVILAAGLGNALGVANGTPPPPRTYAALRSNLNGNWGGYPVLGWKGTSDQFTGITGNGGGGSRYCVPFNARSSLLCWKIFGARLDGRKDGELPAPTTPGDPTTLPLWQGQPIPASQYGLCDIGWSGKQCPPPGAMVNGVAVPPLSEDEKRDFARWIDLGMPFDLAAWVAQATGQPKATGGWFQDETPPTLCITMPARGANASLSSLVFGLADLYAGLDPATISVTADFPVDGNAAGTNLASLFTSVNGVYSYTLKSPPASLATGNFTVKAADKQGNRVALTRTFSVAGAPPPPPGPTPAQQIQRALAAIQQAQGELQAALLQLQAPQARPANTLKINPPPFRMPKGGGQK